MVQEKPRFLGPRQAPKSQTCWCYGYGMTTSPIVGNEPAWGIPQETMGWKVYRGHSNSFRAENQKVHKKRCQPQKATLLMAKALPTPNQPHRKETRPSTWNLTHGWTIFPKRDSLTSSMATNRRVIFTTESGINRKGFNLRLHFRALEKSKQHLVVKSIPCRENGNNIFLSTLQGRSSICAQKWPLCQPFWVPMDSPWRVLVLKQIKHKHLKQMKDSPHRN